MDGLALFLIGPIVLATLARLAAAFGAESRDGFGESAGRRRDDEDGG